MALEPSKGGLPYPDFHVCDPVYGKPNKPEQCRKLLEDLPSQEEMILYTTTTIGRSTSLPYRRTLG